MKKGRILVFVAVLAGLLLAQAAIADVLFKYPVEANVALDIGTVVKMDEITERVVKAASGDRDIIGVVVGYEYDDPTHYVLVASSGQYPVNAATSVNAGDRLTISGTVAGQAITATNEDVLIGIAMTDEASGMVTAQLMVDDNQAQYSAYDHTGDSYITSDNVDGALGQLDTKIADILAGTGSVNSLNPGDITTATNEGAGIWHVDVSTDAGDFVETAGVLALADNAIQSDEIEDLTIVNDDIAAAAAVAVSKLAAGTDGQIISTVAGTPTWSDVSAVNQDLTDGAGIVDFTYDGSAVATVVIDNAWFDGDAQVDASGVVTIQDNAVQASDVDWGTAGDQASAVDVPIADADGHFTTDNVEFAIDDLADRLDDIEGGGGQFTASDDATVVALGNVGLWKEIASVAIPAITTTDDYIVLTFTGTFDDRAGGNNGAYIKVAIGTAANGTENIESREVILINRDFHQSQEVSVSCRVTRPAAATTYYVVAQSIKAPYEDGQCTSGEFIAQVINE